MRNRRMVGLIALIALLLIVFVVQWSYQGSYDKFVDAQRVCPNSVWVVRRDSPFHHVYKADTSNEDKLQAWQTSTDKELSFSCSQQAADKVVRFEKTLQIGFYILFIPIWLPLALITLVAWWVYGEYRNFQKPKKKDT